MRITWITRSFLDYRIPIYKEINRLSGHSLTVIYYAEVVPQRCQEKLHAILGERAIGLSGEFRLSGKKSQPLSSAKKNRIRIPIQPGLIKEIKKSNPEILLSDGFFQWTYAALWLRLWRKIPHLMLYEGTEHTERNAGKLRTLYRKLASKLIDQISCNGTLSANYVASLGYPEAKIRQGNMAADTENLLKMQSQFSKEERLKLKNKLGLNRFVFLFVGRLVTLKGVDKLLDVWLQNFASKNNASMLIVGGGPEKDRLQNKCMDNNCKNVIFTGEIDYDFIYQYFAITNVFLIPTLQDNWSLVVPEAMSCGLPVLSSKYNGCWPELIKNENGWVFDPLDADNFKNTLQTAWENKNRWKEMGENSLEIIKDYTPEKIAQMLYQTCKAIINK